MEKSRPEHEEWVDLTSTLRAVHGAQDQDELSWSRLDEKLRPWLRAILEGSHRVPPGVGVDDVLGEVFLTVYRDIADFDVTPGANFRGWLITIANRRLNDLWRRYRAQKRASGRQVQLTDTVGRALPQEEERSHSSVLGDQEMYVCLREKLAQLTEKQRQVLEYRMLQGLSYAQVAQRMGYRNEATIRSLFVNAKRRLQELMRPHRSSPV